MGIDENICEMVQNHIEVHEVARRLPEIQKSIDILTQNCTDKIRTRGCMRTCSKINQKIIASVPMFQVSYIYFLFMGFDTTVT